MPLTVTVRSETWPIAGSFTISRGSKTAADVVVVELCDGSASGRGECTPYGRYGETVTGVTSAIKRLAPEISGGLDRAALQHALPSGAARNALDCAFIDLEAKRRGCAAHELLGLPAPRPRVTAYTISLGPAENMAAGAAAAAAAGRPLLKVKLGAAGDPQRLAAIRAAAPDVELIVDANEGWRAENLAANFAACQAARVSLIEQPLPAGDDGALIAVPRPVAVCADESVHDRSTLPALAGKYDAVNIKLDKTGGLTEALALAAQARTMGLEVMIGCMIATSLSMAPALLLADQARLIDLDGPLLLARDRADGVRFEGSVIFPASSKLWG